MNARYGLLLFIALVGCREDPGSFDYSSHEGVRQPVEFLPGPTPYVSDVPRLWLQVFYEPAGDERVFPFNADNTFIFAFDTAGDGTGAFTVNDEDEESSDRVQGEVSNRIVHQGFTFWGLGVFWFQPRDISQYTTFNISLKSTSTAAATFDEITLVFTSGAANPAPTVTSSVGATEYGYVNDGEWHSLTIPISDLEARGFIPFLVRSPLGLGGDEGTLGDSFLIDDVYYQ